MKIKKAKVADLVFDPNNRRKRTKRNLAAIRYSLERFGQRLPLIVRGNVVHVGNGRLQVMRELGWESCEVTPADDLTPDDLRDLGLVDNRSAELAEWDDRGVYEDLKRIGDQQVIDGLGWSDREFVAFVAGMDSQVDEDDAPELPKRATTKPGDVWRLGRHVLLCGDSTKREDVAKLMGKSRAALMFTDPPYGVIFGGAKKNAISGDLTQAVIPISFAVAVDHALDDNARLYLCGGSTNFEMYAKLFDHHLQLQPRILVWAKDAFVLRRRNYHSQFEFIYFGWKGRGGGDAYWYSDRKQSDLWTVDRDREYLHPTQKPVELPARGIRNSAAPGGIVFEPFGGSGSTLIAAEQLDRPCRVMELDPKFADVIVERWQNVSGGKAKRVGATTAKRPRGRTKAKGRRRKS